MYLNSLEFEKPIAELEAKIADLKRLDKTVNVDIEDEIRTLEGKVAELTKQIFKNLTTMQIVQLARHPLRPYTKEYIDAIFTDFDELSGDRMYAAGYSIIAGLARFEGQPVIVMGHQKGRKTAEKVQRNFGMPRPEDYRKTQRLFELARRFELPLILFIDTAGAYPGVGAEERNQSEAIARNLFMLSDLPIPIISIVTGEGGSGGALALGVADRVAMLQYSVYSVISPEGCASILWKSADRASDAAAALQVNAEAIYSAGFVDAILSEPMGGAHRNPEVMAQDIKAYIQRELAILQQLPKEELLALRYAKLTRSFARHD